MNPATPSAGRQSHRIGSVTFSTPSDWKIEPRENGRFLKRYARPVDGTVSCDVVVITDACADNDSEIDNFLSQGRQSYKGRTENPAELKTPNGSFRGFIVQGAHAIKQTPEAGEPTSEVYAARFASDLVTVSFTIFAANPNAMKYREECLTIAKSIALSAP